MADQEIDTILGDDIQFRGKLLFKQNLKINGFFKGKIQTAGHLIVGTSAQVEADVEAGTVTIEGKLQGNVVATRKLDIARTAQVKGDVRTPDFTVESGSKFSGHCIMD